MQILIFPSKPLTQKHEVLVSAVAWLPRRQAHEQTDVGAGQRRRLHPEREQEPSESPRVSKSLEHSTECPQLPWEQGAAAGTQPLAG